MSSEAPINPKKGSISDAVAYPRPRRATIGCEVCRSRKSRCDGNRPKCRQCSELNTECIYREPGIKLDAGNKLVLEHLTRIEGLLHSSHAGQTVPPALSSSPPAASSNSGEDTRHGASNLISTIPDSTSVVGLGSFVSPPTSLSTMPKMHTTPALHLLQWPLISDLSFLDLVNVWYACVNPYNWARYHRTALSQGFRDGPESCVVLLVLALGCASNNGSISYLSPEREPPGMSYFAAAWELLPSQMMRNSILSAQCMILASAYLFYLVRPLEAWTLLSNISIKLQLQLGASSRIPPQWKELSDRIYWNTLLFESDLLAELDFPPSGIVQFEETAELLGGFDEEHDEEPAGRDELWYFISEIALRRLLNRVSHMIYQRELKPSTGTFGAGRCRA
ncbi:hypothetical protein ACJ72_07576 [Emergomyces africanus]|uniref:Zn(2)-C6 fungal-type domain-containing protein n=1 Tax=Emergomyces africanus TaxID=1955775 RepID=A0A1B7NMR8_9EURO|nr:hypothetical protein ACJ72_07576 [Emergomyces africanus]